MSERTCFIMGLPSAGKTSFLAALSHSLIQKKEKTMLRWPRFTENSQYLTQLSEMWLAGEEPGRTQEAAQQKSLRLELEDDGGQEFQVSFPDLSGELFQRCLADREIDRSLADTIKQSDGIMLFISPETVHAPKLISELPEDYRMTEQGEPKSEMPTEVELVELLQFAEYIRNGKPANLSIVVSAWDILQGSVKNPVEYLQNKLPLLWQFLQAYERARYVHCFGVSAQGGSYDVSAAAMEEMLRNYELNPIMRIQVVDSAGSVSHDITELLWVTMN